MIDWRAYIIADDSVLSGKPSIKNTRLSVEFVIKLLANGWTEEQILSNYPRLSPEALRAVFAFTHECMQDGLMYPLEPQEAA